jgi:5-hydroxyisourate hydrolase
MSAVSTHVLDTVLGVPATGVLVRLEDVGGSREIARARTDSAGRINDLGPAELPAGTYRLVFDTAEYFARGKNSAFFPEVAVTFTVDGAQRHHHVPLLLSPFAYATYRGS